MKKIFTLLSLFYFVFNIQSNTNLFAQDCCPEFILKDAFEICPPEGACTIDDPGINRSLAACKNTTHTYTVYPNDPAYSYTWTVMGGSPANYNLNPIDILWSAGASGYIKVVISNIASGGTCIDSLMQEVCLIDGPQANFILSHDTVCLNTPVHFTNTSLGGSSFSWDFGDGTTSNLANPPDHSYSVPGLYTVTLTATDMGAGEWVSSQEPPIEMLVPCGCSDTISYTVLVLPGEGPVIETDCCYGTVCPGDTSYFCSPNSCTTFNWVATGGNIISGLGTDCIAVQWNNIYSGPTTVSLTTPGCGSAPCDGTTTHHVPVLYPNLPITGPNNLCQGASGSFTLPTLPGTYYTWSVTGGYHTFNLQDRNTPHVNITFHDIGIYWVHCDYNNPIAGCSGSDSIQVEVLQIFSITGDEIVCEASTTTFNSNGNANWTISPAGPTFTGNGSSTINVSWLPGNYTITATPINTSLFCNTNASKNIEVIPLPILNNIIGKDSICPNNNFTYSISSNVSGENFVWSISNGTGIIHSEMGADKDSVIIEWTNTGPWELSVYQEIEISPGIFCTSLIKTLTINSFLPPNISGVNTVCADAVEIYSAGGSNPSGNFQWTISPPEKGTIISGQGTNTVNVKWHGPSGTANLSVTNCAGSDSFTINVNAPPIAVASYDILPVFCLGDLQTLNLSTIYSGTYSYQWYENGVPIGGANSDTYPINIGSYTSTGTYQFYVEVTENGCTIISNIINVIIKDCPSGGGDCDAVADFFAYVECDMVTLSDQSYVIAPSTITGYQWSVSGPGTGTFSPSDTDPNPILTVSVSGTYCITLEVTSSSGCTSEWQECVNILLPNASFTYTAPSCVNEPITFTAIPNNPNFQYFWDFGDGSTSYEPVSQHSYSNASPPPYTVTLLIKDEYGCEATSIQTIDIHPLPICTLSYSDTIFCPGSFVTLSACVGLSPYQWYKDGNMISGANSITFDVFEHGLYWVEVSNSSGCTNISDSVYIYMNSLPEADIYAERSICAIPGNNINIPLSTIYNVDYTYNWYSNPTGASFSPPNNFSTTATLLLPGSLPAIYEFIVEVTDINSGCMNYDTVCISFYEQPTLSVPWLGACEGNSVVLTPTPNDPSKYYYLWSNGETTPIITASEPGFYSLTMTDKIFGCSTSADAGFIFPKPDVSLFPLGCEYLCSSDDILNLYIPLPLDAFGMNSTYPGAYPNITWYEDGNYGLPIGTGENLSYSGSSSGNHEISVVVQNSFWCSDTAGVFCVSVDTTVNFQVSTETLCGCDTTLTFDLIDNVSGIIRQSFTISDCESEFTICIDPDGSYDLIASNGVIIHNAIVNGLINYPSGTAPFHIGNEAICCFAASDSSFTHITSNIIYSSDKVWDNKYYIADNVIVKVNSGAILDITNVDVVFGICAGIEFEDGALLRANNSVFRPCNIDETWLGLRFDGSGEFDNIINESTFKNAEVALYFQNFADGVISNNLFSNCNYGVRVEGNYQFDHPISGNRFVLEEFYPEYIGCYSFVNNLSTYGIYSTSSRFLQQVSHNEFLNSIQTNYPRSYGIYQYRGGGIFSENTFSDFSTSFFVNMQQFYTDIENNEIELNVPINNFSATIFALNSNGPIVEINNNEISNNFNQLTIFSAIYTSSLSNVSILNNEIDGFYNGIINLENKNYQISNNEINDCSKYGIYIYEKSPRSGYITCNSINMRSYNNTVGLIGYGLSSSTEISSNCINDCYTSMHFNGFNSLELPWIRNNFLYNYSYIGIDAQNYSGNIGSVTDPGLNTLWSNNNSSVDINSNSTINVADNFGMFNISWPQVQITSNNPYHSTASCGHQIFNMPSQGNLNTDFVCDNFENIIYPLDGFYGDFELSDDFYLQQIDSDDPYSFANMILSSLESSDIGLLNDLINEMELSDNESALLEYNFYYRVADYQTANNHLSEFMPETISEFDLKRLLSNEINILEGGWSSLSNDEINTMEEIISRESMYANFAVSLLNNIDSYRDHIFNEIIDPQIYISDEIRNVEENDIYLNIFPNPVTNVAHIEIVNSGTGIGRLEIIDNTGKKVSDYQVNLVAGEIQISTADLPKGFYIVTLTNTESGIFKVGKMVKIN